MRHCYFTIEYVYDRGHFFRVSSMYCIIQFWIGSSQNHSMYKNRIMMLTWGLFIYNGYFGLRILKKKILDFNKN